MSQDAGVRRAWLWWAAASAVALMAVVSAPTRAADAEVAAKADAATSAAAATAEAASPAAESPTPAQGVGSRRPPGANRPPVDPKQMLERLKTQMAARGVRMETDVEYAQVGGKSLTLDLYLPKDAKEPLPLVVWIHGGGWQSGSKEQCRASELATQGYAVASINYRLSQEAIFPAQIWDCKGAIRWLRAHAKEYGLDGGRVGVWGSSAGGHLVALLGTSGDVKEMEGDVGGNPDQSSRVQAVCDWFGPSDFTTIAEQAHPGRPGVHSAATGAVGSLLGGPVAENMDKARAASPVTYVTKDDPPFLIMHGDRDGLVPLAQSEELRDVLEQKGGAAVTLYVVKGAGHGFAGADLSAMVKGFFDKYLKAAAGTSTPAGEAKAESSSPAAKP